MRETTCAGGPFDPGMRAQVLAAGLRWLAAGLAVGLAVSVVLSLLVLAQAGAAPQGTSPERGIECAARMPARTRAA